MKNYRELDPLILDENLTVGQSLDSFYTANYMNLTFPFIVRLTENPKYAFFGKNLLFIPGAVDSITHDIIHILLGRGFLPEDEAFVLGFTAGSTGQWNKPAEWLYNFIAKFLYPRAYKFNAQQLAIFQQGIYASGKFAKSNLTTITYQEEHALTVVQLRQKYLTDWQGLLNFYVELISQFDPCSAHNRLKSNIGSV